LPLRYADGPNAWLVTHMFGMRRRENGIEHRCTKVNHLYDQRSGRANDPHHQAAIVQRYHYGDQAQLSRHLDGFVSARDFGHLLKLLKRLPRTDICRFLVPSVECGWLTGETDHGYSRSQP
jgi:hypothetical protein